MLEASSCDLLNSVSPFLGAIANRYCENSKWADVSRVFTQYVELLHRLYLYGLSPSEAKKIFLFSKRRSPHSSAFSGLSFASSNLRTWVHKCESS